MCMTNVEIREMSARNKRCVRERPNSEQNLTDLGLCISRSSPTYRILVIKVSVVICTAITVMTYPTMVARMPFQG